MSLFTTSFENVWSIYEDLMKLDPILMKVILYLCPKDQLDSIVLRVHPFFVLSFVIHVYKDNKNINEREVQ